MLVYALAAAAAFALVEIARGFPSGAERNLHTHAATALLALLRDLVLHALDVQTAFDVGIDSVGGGGGAFEGGVAAAAQLNAVGG
jgi:hypothetical protein